MRLFWKHFLGILSILIMMFTIFGTMLLQSCVTMWVEREVENSLNEITMFQYAFKTAVQGSKGTYQSQEKLVTGIAENIIKSMGSYEDTIVIYNAERESLFSQGKHYNELRSLDLAEGESLAWCVMEREGVHYLETLSRVTVDGDDYYLEKNHSIQQVYDNRDALLQNYYVAMLFLLLFSAVLAVIFSMGFTAPIRRLSQATKGLARGDYSKRVKPSGNDEITDLMEDFNAMADRLEENIDELNDAVRRQEEFTGAFAHELKTPLTSIIGYSELLMSIDISEEARMMSAGYIYQEGKRLERLAYKMMELVRVDKQDIPFRPVKIEELMEAIRATTSPMLIEKGITLKIQTQDACLQGDKDLLLSLLFNLVDNARKASSEGGIIHITGINVSGGYQLEIRDHGRGMPKQEVPRVAEAFYMVDKSRARKEGGAGLGMALCAKIVALHHGQWEIQSAEGKGTTIRILFEKGEDDEEKE